MQFIDATDYHSIKSVRLGDDSDNVRYDPAAKHLFIGYGGGSLAAVSPGDGKVLGEAKLAGHPESFQPERTGSRVFVNMPTADRIAMIDRTAMRHAGGEGYVDVFQDQDANRFARIAHVATAAGAHEAR